MTALFAGRYALGRLLGRGGMCDVWLARDATDGTECALKHVRHGATPEVVLRMRREFEAIAALRHPALVRVHDLGFTPAGEPYLTMEYAPGVPADQALPAGDWPSLLWFAARVARGLEAMHDAGVAHGDIKPANLLVVPPAGDNGLPRELRIIDLGLASVHGATGVEGAGTRGFAAPEVVAGEAASEAADLYALGVTLYVLIAPDSAAARRREGFRAGDLDAAGAPEPLVRLTLSLLSPRANERPASAGEVALELESLHRAAREPLTRRLEGEVFAGRLAERARFAAALADGRSPLILIEGDAGVGKSALLGQFAIRAQIDGCPVLRVQPQPAGIAIALRQLAALAEQDRTAEDPAVQALLAGEQRPLSGEAATLARDSALRWIARVSRRGKPLVFLADDMDRADDVTCGWWVRLLQHTSRPRCVAVWTARPAPAGTGGGTGALAEAGQALRWELGALSEEDADHLAEALLGESPPHELSGLARERAAGHPGMIVALLRAAAAAGALTDTGAGLQVVPARLAALDTPLDFEAGLLERCSALPPPAQELLTALAVCPEALPEATLAGWLDGGFAAARDQVLAARVVRRTSAGELAILSPALARRWFAARGSDERGKFLGLALARPGVSDHERFDLLRELGRPQEALAIAGQAFATAPEYRLAAHAAELAEQAGDAALQGAWHERAAAEAYRDGRLESAARQARLAWLRAEHPPERGRRAVLHATALERLRRGDELEEFLAGALAGELPAAEQAILSCSQGFAAWLKGDAGGALETYDRALKLARTSGDDEAIARCCVYRSYASSWRRQFAESEAFAREALDHANRSGSVGCRLRALNALGLALQRQDRLADALPLFDDALRLATDHGEEMFALDNLWNRAGLVFDSGDWRGAARSLRELALRALANRTHRHVVEAMILLASIDMFAGRRRATLRRARIARRLDTPGSVTTAARAVRVIGGVLLRTGEPARARRLLERNLARLPLFGHPEFIVWNRLEHAFALMALDQWPAVASALGPLAAAPPRDLGEAVAATAVGRAALRAGEVPRARLLLEHVARHGAGNPRKYLDAHVQQLRTEVAIAEGDPDLARAAASATLALFAGFPAPYEHAAAQLEFARLAVRHERAASLPVAEWLTEAAAAFDRLGNHLLRLRALETQLALAPRSVVARAGDDEPELYDALGALMRSLTNPQQLAERALGLASRRFEAERGALLLWNDEAKELSTLAEFGPLDDDSRRSVQQYSRRAVDYVLATQRSLVLTDAVADSPFDSRSVMELRLRSIVCVPLIADDRVIGAIYLDDSRHAGQFRDAERGMLEGFANMVSSALTGSLGRRDVEQTSIRLLRENVELRRAAGESFHRGRALLGESAPMRGVQAQIEQIAPVGATVLITGETGSGKDLVARAIHHLGPDARGPFEAVNCGALPEKLLEAEIFGTARGAATDVLEGPGIFERANGGTVFLDEIGEMPLAQQVALLRVLDNREVTRIRGHKPIPFRARVISATNRNLAKMVSDGLFRADLYFRLAVVPIEVPPLREHKSDIRALAEHYVRKFAADMKRPAPKMSDEFVATLVQSDWPGNIRELMNYLERSVAMNTDGILRPLRLPSDLESKTRVRVPLNRTLKDAIDELSARMIERALQDAGGNKSEAARKLGVPEATLRYQMRRTGATRPRRN